MSLGHLWRVGDHSAAQLVATPTAFDPFPKVSQRPSKAPRVLMTINSKYQRAGVRGGAKSSKARAAGHNNGRMQFGTLAHTHTQNVSISIVRQAERLEPIRSF